MAASERIDVVSWNEAADRKLSVCKDALVIPKTITSAVEGSPPPANTLLFSSSNLSLSINSPGRRFVSP